MRVLDEVAEAMRRARGGPLPALSAFGLEELLGGPPEPRQWGVIEKCLGGELPPLRFDQGHWFLPDGFATIWDLTDYAAAANPAWEPPHTRTADTWRNALVFAYVRTALVDALAVEPKQVTRETRLVDLI